MEPIMIALICAAAFGGVMVLAAFIRQLLLSRDKLLNDEAQKMALTHEASELEKMRDEMQDHKRFDNHYTMLNENKEAIAFLDQKIEAIFNKKAELVDRYTQITVKESAAIVDGDISPARKEACRLLRNELDEEIQFYERELKQLQERRASLWDTHVDFQEYLLSQEQSRNKNLDTLYERHSGVLEKIYIRHTDDSENVAKQSITASTSTFKSIILAPLQFLLQYFNLSTGISFDKSKIEQAARDDVSQAENEANGTQNDTSLPIQKKSKADKATLSVDMKLFA
jgi:hypothetical protein